MFLLAFKLHPKPEAMIAFMRRFAGLTHSFIGLLINIGTLLRQTLHQGHAGSESRFSTHIVLEPEELMFQGQKLSYSPRLAAGSFLRHLCTAKHHEFVLRAHQQKHRVGATVVVSMLERSFGLVSWQEMLRMSWPVQIACRGMA